MALATQTRKSAKKTAGDNRIRGSRTGDAVPAPPKLQRRPLLVALGVLFIAVGALLASYLVTAASDAQPVVALRRDVPRGTVLQREDLIEARIDPDPALRTVPVAEMGQVVGRRTRIDLGAGGLVSFEALATSAVPEDGQSIVGVALSPAQMPGQPLPPGTRVRIVSTPRQQDDPPVSIPEGLAATVVSQRSVDDTGHVVIDVSVKSGEAARLAGVVATGRLALVLDKVT